ncbi:MAG: ferrochelatase [SAR324 cluster bacterium]|nr:ferrochelatase [SAR324 cluster bacterium]
MSNPIPTKTQKAVVLLNFGGPGNLAEVADFLFEILRDPNTIQLPFPLSFQDRLARRIANKRSVEVAEQYEQIGGRSPIVEATEKQRQNLEADLRKAGSLAKVYVAHRYIPGNTRETIQQMIRDGIDDIYLIPMYPHFSGATTGSSIEQFCQLLAQSDYTGKVQALRSYPNHPDYIEGLSDLIQKALSELKLDPEKTRILCSAHGLPQSYVDQGDPYLMEMISTVEELRKNFPQWQFDLCFQSRVGPAKWLQPYTDVLIKELPEQGVQSIFFVPLSFVNDHLETLFEIDDTYFNLARSVNLTPYRLNALETHPQFIKLLCEKALLWEQGVQGIDPALLMPASQQFRRYDQWILYVWVICFLTAFHFAIA